MVIVTILQSDRYHRWEEFVLKQILKDQYVLKQIKDNEQGVRVREK